MAVDSMNTCIHAAVRRDFGRLDAALRAAPDGDRGRAADLQRAWAHLCRQLRTHHGHEDTIFWPALRGLGVAPDLLATMEEEHEAMSRAMDEVDVAMASYAASGSAQDAAAALETVKRGFIVVERHFDHEEREVEPAMKPYLDTTEWRQAERRVRKQSPAAIGTFFAWLQDGGPEDAVAYFRGTLPAPVRIVFTTLFGRDYRKRIAPVWS